MRFVSTVFSNVGGRENNEDNAGYIYKNGEYGVWVVADGLGGHLSGEKASKIAVDAILNTFEANPEPTAKNIEYALTIANSAILSEQAVSAKNNGMRTTVVALFTNCKDIIWAHIGDSRFYWFRNGRLSAQTKDHSVSQMAASLNEISHEEIRNHEDRNKLLRVLGNSSDLKPEIHRKCETVERGDAFLLCTDGFWEHVYEVEMEIDLAKSATTNEWLKNLTDRLSTRVRGNHDNFTAIAVFVE